MRVPIISGFVESKKYKQTNKQDSDFPFLFLNFNSIFRIHFQKNLLVLLKMNIHEHWTNQTYELQVSTLFEFLLESKGL